jgi:hypothetical protein
MAAPPLPVPLTCSWCGKLGDEVRVVAGPNSNICEACVRLVCAVLSIQILPEATEPDTGQPAKPEV